MTLEELKARAYDLIAIRERAMMELNQINQRIANFKEKSDNSKKEKQTEEASRQVNTGKADSAKS